ncbi:hypothetical protein CCACVL1_29616 [Corchorus capsularis]|uniref:Uncharacterized protein n=1 Tax=Corchorus capsularis TaxID=210143 RepID=A0A1R3G0X8_COCAP|nr:hypothetical protein CCACVL1_29616 [Corchorus capsularis]
MALERLKIVSAVEKYREKDVEEEGGRIEREN